MNISIWNIIPQISSISALIAFVIAVIAWIYKIKSEEQERRISLAKDNDRAVLVKATLEFFDVDTAGLTKEQ